MMKFTNAVVIVFLLFLTGGCQSKIEVHEPFICLSFDDLYLESWVSVLPLLDRYNAKVTFFLTGVSELGEQEQEHLQQLILSGHDFGAHGELHVSANQFIQQEGYLSYWREEIRSNRIGLNKLGLYPKVFAYPYGEKNSMIDPIIKTCFSHTRNVARASEIHAARPIMLVDKIGKEIYSLGIDNGENLETNTLESIMDIAVSQKMGLFIHAHDIGNHAGYMLAYTRLEEILKMARKKGLPLLTYAKALDIQ